MVGVRATHLWVVQKLMLMKKQRGLSRRYAYRGCWNVSPDSGCWRAESRRASLPAAATGRTGRIASVTMTCDDVARPLCSLEPSVSHEKFSGLLMVVCLFDRRIALSDRYG